MARLTRWATPLAWLALAAALVGCALFAHAWLDARAWNAAIDARTVETRAPLPADERIRYAAGWDHERAQRYDDAIALFNDARAARDPKLATAAWFALGNAYFESAIKASRAVAAGESIESAQLDLARDAYRAALRLDPNLHGARYNLELLERLAPGHPSEGWRRTTDPISIQADRHIGWTTIRESPKRGLP